MSRLNTFIRKHAIWIGFVAVAVPIVVNTRLQYDTLVRLEEATPVARKAVLAERLSDVASEVEGTFQTSARRALDVPADAILSGDADAIAAHFAAHPLDEARETFVALAVRDRTSQVLFYDAAERRLEARPDTPEWVAVHAACSPWMVLAMKRSLVDPNALAVDERDGSNRVLIRPIVDATSRTLGVTGIVLDEARFRARIAAEVGAALPKFFSQPELDDAAVSLRETGGRAVFDTRPGEGRASDEVAVPLPFVFKDWSLGVRRRGMSLDQGARYLFVANLAMSLLSTIALVAGVAFALRTASRELRLSRMKTDFVSNVSHELRTPLASIRVFGELLAIGRVEDPAKVRRYGEYIESESRRLTQLINNILDFSKIESGQKGYRFELADVRGVVASTVEAFALRTQQAGFAVTLDAPADAALPPVLLDADAMSQAVTNLLDNAVKYSGEGREVFVRVAPSPTGGVAISVTDLGVGIPREEHEKIFERFHRVSTGLVHDVKGSGLGLSIVDHVVKAHGGRIEVRSEPGRGSTFTIQLPGASAAAAAAEGRDGAFAMGLGDAGAEGKG